MRYFPLQGVGVLVRGSQTLELQQEPEGSGFRYSNGTTVVRGKGKEITIEEGGKDALLCWAR